MSGSDPGARSGNEPPVVRDKRRVHFNPATGATSEPSASGHATAAPKVVAADTDSIEVGQLRIDIAERTADLQRLQAEYANYRKRVERDREAVRDFAVGEALATLLPVLDDIGRARDHGELEGGFRQVAEALDAAVAKLGLIRFGQPGDPFDPSQHEALLHSYSDQVTEPTAVAILQPGYSYAGRVVRPARVAVAEPTTPLSDTGTTDDTSGDTSGDIAVDAEVIDDGDLSASSESASESARGSSNE